MNFHYGDAQVGLSCQQSIVYGDEFSRAMNKADTLKQATQEEGEVDFIIETEGWRWRRQAGWAVSMTFRNMISYYQNHNLLNLLTKYRLAGYSTSDLRRMV